MKPSRPRRLSSARSAARRSPPGPRSARSSKDWNRASNITGNLLSLCPKGERVWTLEDQGGPTVELDAPLQRELAIGRERRIRLRFQQAGENDAAARRNRCAQGRRQLLQRRKEDIGQDQIERRAGAQRGQVNAIRATDANQIADPIK